MDDSAHAATSTEQPHPGPHPNPRAVFVVHGRNNALRDSMFGFLRALDLAPLEWDRAVELTTQGSPYIGDVLDAAFDHAQAVVVLLTPDEVAYLQPRYTDDPDDPDTNPSEQARPNVLFEAGMALGRNANRTVIVEIGRIRPFSDITGRHTIRLTNSATSRKSLATRLATTGLPANTTGTDWLTVGDFTPPQPAGATYPLGRRIPSDPKPRPAIDFDVKYHGKGGKSLAGTLIVTNRGTETAYDVTVHIPQEASLSLREPNDVIHKIPGAGKSVSLTTLNRGAGRLGGGGFGDARFDLAITARTENGEPATTSHFIDTNG